VLVWRPAPPGAPPLPRAFGAPPPGPGDEPEGDPSAPAWRVAGALKGHADDVMDVAWAPDGSALLSGCVENELVVFDVEARRSVVRRGGPRERGAGCGRAAAKSAVWAGREDWPRLR
jgi:WD40 repeat protein